MFTGPFGDLDQFLRLLAEVGVGQVDHGAAAGVLELHQLLDRELGVVEDAVVAVPVGIVADRLQGGQIDRRVLERQLFEAAQLVDVEVQVDEHVLVRQDRTELARRDRPPHRHHRRFSHVHLSLIKTQ